MYNWGLARPGTAVTLECRARSEYVFLDPPGWNTGMISAPSGFNVKHWDYLSEVIVASG